jgi:hypothetical protein
MFLEGYIVDEQGGNLCTVESDEPPTGPENYARWTVSNAHVMTVAAYREQNAGKGTPLPAHRPVSSFSSLDKELFLSCLNDIS